MFFWDPTMVIVLPGLMLAIWAQFKVKGTFARYRDYGTRSGMTADQVARTILRQGGLPVEVEHVRGDLTDHYDPFS